MSRKGAKADRLSSSFKESSSSVGDAPEEEDLCGEDGNLVTQPPDFPPSLPSSRPPDFSANQWKYCCRHVHQV